VFSIVYRIPTVPLFVPVKLRFLSVLSCYRANQGDTLIAVSIEPLLHQPVIPAVMVTGT
jgi:predicted ATPase